MTAELVLRRCRLRGRDEPVDVAIRGDRVCAVGAGLAGTREHDADGRVALPGLVEAHRWDCERPEDVVAALAPCRLVVKDGEIVASTETQTRQPWREKIER